MNHDRRPVLPNGTPHARYPFTKLSGRAGVAGAPVVWVGEGAGMENGRSRVVIERVSPEVDCGRFPIKRTIGEAVVVEADAYADGHDAISLVLLHRREGEDAWTET